MIRSVKDIFECFRQLNWPCSINTHEDTFNKKELLKLFKTVSCLNDIEVVKQKELRNSDALPFFGWGAYGETLSKINGKVKSDLTFKKDDIFLLIENKLIRDGKKEECNIKNALVQTIEYLNFYNVDGAILLIFDAGRAKDRRWNNKEYYLINCLISKYPLCVVRVREDCDTEIYYERRQRWHG